MRAPGNWPRSFFCERPCLPTSLPPLSPVKKGEQIMLFVMEELKNGSVCGSSSPPTPPSPLPVSVGPGNHKYLFSPSPSPSPPFSPSPSTHASAENLPLLHDNPPSTPAQVTSTFSLDRKHQDEDEMEDKSSCLRDLLEWLVQKCCRCRS